MEFDEVSVTDEDEEKKFEKEVKKK